MAKIKNFQLKWFYLFIYLQINYITEDFDILRYWKVNQTQPESKLYYKTVRVSYARCLVVNHKESQLHVYIFHLFSSFIKLCFFIQFAYSSYNQFIHVNLMKLLASSNYNFMKSRYMYTMCLVPFNTPHAIYKILQ